MKSRRNRINIFLFFLYFGLNTSLCLAQDPDKQKNEYIPSPLFENEKVLSMKMSYSKQDILTYANDSTYIDSEISYRQQDGTWKNLPVKIKARGNFRKQNCYYLPLWIKINKSISKETAFENDKKLKVVLPCFKSSSSNDLVIKEYLAYKIYEILSPYYFNTKLISINLMETRKNKQIEHNLTGIFIQDDKRLAAKYGGDKIKRHMHPNVQDPMASTRNALFQYMIGNTDYSIAYRHNEKLFYIDNRTVPIPYDFDMAGLVNTSYAVVSQIKNETLPIENVTQRMYRGFKRSPEILQLIRQEFLDKETDVFQMVDQYKPYFKNQKEFDKARDYLSSFYKIIKDDKKFETRIVKAARTELK